MVKDILEKIIDGCSEVEKEKDAHKDAKVLAKLVKKDCNDALAELNKAAEDNGEEL
jgi:hypothetical protein